MPNFGSPQYRYPDLVERLSAMLTDIQARREDQALQQTQLARQARIDAAAEEERQRQVARQDLQQQISLAQLERGAAAETPLTEAPQAPLATQPLPGLTEEHGALSPEEAAYVGGETPVPKRQVEITLPGGRKIPLAPLQYKEEAESEAKRLRGETMAEALRQLGLKEEIVQGIRAEHRPERPEVRHDVLDTKTGKPARVTPEEESAEPGRYVPFREPKAAGAKEQEDAERKAGAQAVATAWRDGLAFPSTQKETTAALVYMDQHPEDFQRRPRKLTPKQQDTVLDATASLDRITNLRNAYEKVKGKVGPISYRLNELGVKLPGIAEDPDFVTFNTALRQLDNLDIKRITGAQMSAQEADRLMKGMATGALKPADFDAALRIMEMDADRQKEITLYGVRQKAGAVAATAAGSQAPGANPKVGDKKTFPNGKIGVWDGAGWAAQ